MLPVFSRSAVPSAEALRRTRTLIAARLDAGSRARGDALRVLLPKALRVVLDIAIVALTPCVCLAGLRAGILGTIHPEAAWPFALTAAGYLAAIIGRTILARRRHAKGEPKTIAELADCVRVLAGARSRSTAGEAALLGDLQEVEFGCPELTRLRESEYVNAYLRRIEQAGRAPVRAEVRVAESLYEQERHEPVH